MSQSPRFSFKVDGFAPALHVARFEGEEGLWQPFHFEVTLVGDDVEVAPAALLGRAAVLTIDAAAAPRHVHGMIARIVEIDDGARHASWRVTLVPRTHRLRHRHDCRIFQWKSVPEIVAAVLDGAGIAAEAYRFALQRDYAAREYCVQYRESDWAFVSRLLEDEGLVSYFDHGAGSHVLVVGDDPAMHEPIARAALPYRPAPGALGREEAVGRFEHAAEIQAGRVTLRDYNFKNPGLSLEVSAAGDVDDDLEIYDFPGNHELPATGERRAAVQLDEQGTGRSRAAGTSSCPALQAGRLFSLAEHPRDGLNRRWIAARVRHRGVQPLHGAHEAGAVPSYENDFEAVPEGAPLRPPRRTPRPRIQGIQTAVVVGPPGEEIHTDEHGRVRVRFHWDRQSRGEEASSCWMRVSQAWAGPAFGAMVIPRIGHEVIVDFLEGDPDRPLVVGRVYHAANVPPYPLPAEKTKTTLRSSSSPGGDGSNELRFEDRAGVEEVYLHAQRDLTVRVENDAFRFVGRQETIRVGHDRVENVGADHAEEIGANKSSQIGKDHSETIGGSDTITVASGRSKSVGGGESEQIGGAKVSRIGGDLTTNVGGQMELSVTGLKKEGCGGDNFETVGGARVYTVLGSTLENLIGSRGTFINGSESQSVKKDVTIRVEGNRTETLLRRETKNVGEQIEIVCGAAKVIVRKDGEIRVEGKDISVRASGDLSVRADKNIVMKANKILQN
jgi:type VI secretion system secreted protein VgrG